MTLTTIAELAEREAELLAELSIVRAAIAARHGECDPPITKRAPRKATAK